MLMSHCRILTFLDMTKKFPVIKTVPIEPSDRFKFNDQDLNFSIVDFWKWNQSDLVENRNRGILAEYIVTLSSQIANQGAYSEWILESA